MLVTNRHNLPLAIYKAAQHDTYTRGASDISVTQLIAPPQLVALSEAHKDELETDVVDAIWSLLGSAVHHLLEVAADRGVVSEERLFMKVLGWTLSGAMDVQNLPKEIIDFKVTSVRSVLYEKSEWTHQLNLYRLLVHENKGVEVKHLRICAILRDWRRVDAERDPTYPQQPIIMVDVEAWPLDRAMAYAHTQMERHQAAAAALDFGDDPEPCSDDDRWAHGTKWAVIKQGNKRAHRVFDDETKATDLARERNAAGGAGSSNTSIYTVERREGRLVRCLHYCPVRRHCRQFNNGQHGRE